MNNTLKKILESLLFQKELTGDNLYISRDEIHNYFNKALEIKKTNLEENKQKSNTNQTIISNPINASVSEKELQNGLNTETKNVVKTVSLTNLDILTRALENTEYSNFTSLDDFNKNICNCQKCPLGKTRTNFVFGEGNPNADIMVIGEGPGADEDALGRPFVGRAGQLLDKILESIKFKREEVYIANIVKCRPPQNRVPKPEEVDKCLPYLIRQIQIINPKMILCVGLTAASYLIPKKSTMQQFRGQFWDFMDKKLLVTYHPAALLRNPNLKKFTWEDVKLFRKYYDNNILKQKSIFD